MATYMTVELTLMEEMLGTASANPELHREYIASKAEDAMSREEEVAALGVDAVVEKGRSVFPRDENGRPMLWDYQVKGFFKDACGVLKKIPGTKSAGLRAYKKDIDGLIFVTDRKIPMDVDSVGDCQRPLRAQTMQGERVTLADSETVPAGTKLRFEVLCLRNSDMALVKEWLDYGKLRGLGQWRNSGKGRFTWEMLEMHKEGADQEEEEKPKKAKKPKKDAEAEATEAVEDAEA